MKRHIGLLTRHKPTGSFQPVTITSQKPSPQRLLFRLFDENLFQEEWTRISLYKEGIELSSLLLQEKRSLL